MKCSACSVDISDDSKFCPECGVTVTQSVACNFCNEPNLPSASFCAECGKPMKADLASVAAGFYLPPALAPVYVLAAMSLAAWV